MLHYFLASKATTKLYDRVQPATHVRKVAVIGGGTMGAGIVVCFLQAKVPVILKEINSKMLQAGVQRVLDTLHRYIKHSKQSVTVVETSMRYLHPQTNYDHFNTVDLVIEAVIEDVALKQKVFQELAQNTQSTTILATNTSTLDIDSIASVLPDQRRQYVVGAHFFSPAQVMPLLEIVTGVATGTHVIASMLQVGKVIGKTSVIAKTCTGFIANRMFMGYAVAATILVLYGIHPYKVDTALMRFGMPMGVF
uniref:Glyoxysomal fatty acid beta-oxidation multifunctional protein MFP-a n=1 Tax=Lygus hesperus TaxID=30085 RepID=A0A0A9WC82_LYGHE